ncbi:MAG: hypothetical protein OEW04_06475 [Nitrospirota bacterium]|nr:hypothetical protein [Nitrospirota bacterium]
MPEITKFQEMNGCSACKHASEKDPQGKSAAAYAAGYWCNVLNKAVNSKDGCACPSWECSE